MIHQVPIKSLPQEWLWCETWCDDESLSTAKAIDLVLNSQSFRATFTLDLEALLDCFGFPLPQYVIGPEKMRACFSTNQKHSYNQSQLGHPCFPKFSRALGNVLVFILSSHWFVIMFLCSDWPFGLTTLSRNVRYVAELECMIGLFYANSFVFSSINANWPDVWEVHVWFLSYVFFVCFYERKAITKK